MNGQVCAHGKHGSSGHKTGGYVVDSAVAFFCIFFNWLEISYLYHPGESFISWQKLRNHKFIPHIKNCMKRHIRPLYVNFGVGGTFVVVFCLVLSAAQLSLASFYFLCFPTAAYVHLDAWCDPYCIVEVDNFWFGFFPNVEFINLDLNDDDIFYQSEA